MKERFTDFHFDYLGYNGIPSWCEVEVWIHKGKYLVILTEPCTSESGTSVTNTCEVIATKLFHQDGVFKKNTTEKDIIWIEHYLEYDETFDLITFQFDDNRFHLPDWKPLGNKLTEDEMKDMLTAGKIPQVF